MARGRFISKEITIDKKVNNLSSPWSMLGFTWLLTHADVNGRTYGDPAVVRSIIFPRRPEVTIDEVEGYIREWSGAGLINWYQVEDDMYIEFPNFAKHQIGLRYDKEAKSSIPRNPATHDPELPEPTPENSGESPENSGESPGKVEDKVKLSGSKGQGEVEVDSDDIAAFCKITHLPIPAVKAIRDAWQEQLTALKEKGVTENIIRRACKELTEKGTYRITSPKSIARACDVVMAEKQRKNDDGYIPNNDPEYAGIVNR